MTLPVLACMRATLFPSAQVRLYGTAGAGICIAKYTVTHWTLVLFFPTTNDSTETDAPMAAAVGGGVELMVGGGNTLSVDYRYLLVPGDARLGGHLVTMGYGLRF